MSPFFVASQVRFTYRFREAVVDKILGETFMKETVGSSPRRVHKAFNEKRFVKPARVFVETSWCESHSSTNDKPQPSLSGQSQRECSGQIHLKV